MTSTLYSPLDRSADEIRLLTFQPGDFSLTKVQLKMCTVSLSTCPVYQALSYTWGHEYDLQSIVINGMSVLVRWNLYSALLELPKQFTDLNLWIDALCINQEDFDERNHQVSRMGKIYDSAQRVLVWLGRAEEDSDLAMQTVRLWGTICYALSQGSDLLRNPALTTKLFNAEAWTAIHSLTSRSWWRRIWVIQELVLSQSAVLICGSEQCEWESFCDAKLAWSHISLPAYECYRQELPSDMLGFNAVKAGDAMMVFRQLSINSKKAPDLVEWIRLTTKYEATDPRDKLYALLGMRKYLYDADVTVKVDYKRPVRQIYCDLVQTFIRKKGDLSVIGGAGIGTANLETPLDLPSWVPDLRNFSMEEECSVFAAANQTRACATFLADSQMLSARGILGGVVQQARPHNDEDDEGFWEPWQNLVLPQHHAIHPTGIPRLQACFRTMICDSSKCALRKEDFLDAEAAARFYSLAAAFLCSIGDTLPTESSVTWKGPRTSQVNVDELNDYVPPFLAWQRLRPSSSNEEDLLEPFLGLKTAEHRLQWPTQMDRNHGQGSLAQFYTLTARKLSNRSLFTMQGGYLGLGPLGTMKGDRLCVLQGCALPLLIRRQSRRQGGRYQLVGQCYVYGIMHGEMFEEVKAGKRHLQTVDLV